MEIIKLDLSLSASKGRLMAKRYDQNSKPIPHSALPLNVADPIEAVYSALSGEEKFNPDTVTFTVKSQGGKFKNLYTPQIVTDLDAECLIIRWGESILPIYLRDGQLTMVNGIYENLKKPKITFMEEEFGEYKKITLKFTLPLGQGKAYVTSIPVKLRDYKEVKGTADLLNMCVDQDDFVTILEKISDISETGGGVEVSGHVIKPGFLPLGTFTLTNFYSYETKDYGTGYVVQAVSESMVDEEGQELNEFIAIANKKDPISGEWLKEEVTIQAGELFAINANKSMKKVLHSGPIMNDEKPALLTVTKKFEYNGNPAVKCEIDVQEFIVDENSFQTDW